MKIQPVLFPDAPNYPRLKDYANEPSLLVKNIPDNWRRNKPVLTALLSFALCNQSCEKFSQKSSRFEIIQLLENKANDGTRITKRKLDSSFVAPLFHHGNGIGVFGCVVIMPPVFINEQEARQIIINELKKEGLIFDSIAQPDQKIIIKTNKLIWEETNGEYRERDTTEIKELEFDGYNKDLNLAFCFISRRNFQAITDEEPETSSVSHDDFKKTSDKVRREIKKANNLNAVVFYEPLPYPDYNAKSERPGWEEWEVKGKECAVDSLKAQVSDFVN
jgi:hypothetical protein